MTVDKKILISGCGNAGLTLAFWLGKRGFEPEIVEKRPDLADEGYMIDFYGPGFDVAEKMGIIEHLRQRHYPIPRLDFVDPRGKVEASFEIERFRRLLGYRHFNFMRGDLETALYEHTRRTVPIRFGTVITGIYPVRKGVEVDFSDGTKGSYGLLIGADGFHSGVRDLVWGPRGGFERFLGYYAASAMIGNILGKAEAFVARQEPGKQAAVYSIRGGKLATFFIFKSKQQGRLTRLDQQAVLEEEFGSMGWEIPGMLEILRSAPRFYYDSVSQIELDTWHKGRIALVGDACQCLTLLAGQGVSMAMAGAHILAKELERSRGDHEAAFSAYEAAMKPEIGKRQVQARKFAGSFVPESRFGITVRNLLMNVLFLPGLRSLFLRRIGAESLVH
ncbi:MAG TPA: FAD-dependent monooxygenase [Nitrospirota bacterium]|nr:FAD-dependent monooxygenase [Nitrospirota bacterium]